MSITTKLKFLISILFFYNVHCVAQINPVGELINNNQSFFINSPNMAELWNENPEFVDLTGSFKPIVQIMKLNTLLVEPPLLYDEIRKDDNVYFDSFCTATMISDFEAVTAKHCIWKDSTMVVRADSLKTNDGTKTNEAAWAYVSKIYRLCSPGWCLDDADGVVDSLSKDSYSSTSNIKYDAVIIVLDKPIGMSTGHFKIHPKTKKTPMKDLILAGFQFDESKGKLIKYSTGPVCRHITMEQESVTLSDCVSAGGLSGSPLFYTKDNEHYILSINSGLIVPGFFGVAEELFGSTNHALYKTWNLNRVSETRK